MKDTIDQWQQSGLSKKAFCRQVGVTYQTFQYWCKRLANVPSAGFAEVNVVGQGCPCACELIFPSGIRLVFHDHPSVNWLREIVR